MLLSASLPGNEAPAAEARDRTQNHQTIKQWETKLPRRPPPPSAARQHRKRNRVAAFSTLSDHHVAQPPDPAAVEDLLRAPPRGSSGR
jgi:hypothetical protein